MNLSSASSADNSPTLQIESFVCGPLDTNLYLLLDAEAKQAVVVDPSINGDVAFELAKKWRDQGITIAAIWNTHGHFDHVYDNARWKAEFDIPILAHRADAFFLDYLREQSLWFELPSPEVAPINRILEEGEILSVGSFDARVLHLPGHSPGSVGFYFESLAVCIVGDVLFNGSVGRTDLPGCSAADLSVSVRALFALPPETQVLPGHGPSSTIGEEVRSNLVARELLAAY